jgi:tRNA/rRNA methyltransferase
MGIRRLIVVGRDDLDLEAVRQMATHESKEIVEGIRHFKTLEEAVADFSWIVGTTARVGAGRGPCLSPRQMAEELVTVARDNDVALLFGPEDTGLTNDELRFCHRIVNIPTAGFRSINLSHAVMILCYEVLVAHKPDEVPPLGKLASSRELEAMYGQLKETLLAIGFLNPQNPDYWMMHIRRLFARTRLYAREVKIIRGICRQIEWYGDHKERKADKNP